MSLQRLAAEIAEDASITAKANEIKSISIHLFDLMTFVGEKDGMAGVAECVQRILYTIEGLAEEIVIDERQREGDAKNTERSKRTAKKAKVRR